MSAPRLAAFCATLAALLCACNDANPQQQQQLAVEVKRKDELPKWLTPIDRVDPAYWLAALEVGAAHFLESPRMLANRAAQLADMMAEIGAAEDEAESIESLARVAAATGSKQTFGDLCQHYFNLRKQGATRESALADLRERYSAQNRGQ